MDQIIEIISKVGGLGAIAFFIFKIGNNYLSKFFSQKQKGEIDKNVEEFRQTLESNRNKTDRYFESQFDVYQRIWKNLQLLNKYKW